MEFHIYFKGEGELSPGLGFVEFSDQSSEYIQGYLKTAYSDVFFYGKKKGNYEELKKLAEKKFPNSKGKK